MGNTGRVNILQKAVHRVFLGRKVCIEKRMIQKHLQASAVTVKLQKVPRTRFLHHALRRDRAGPLRRNTVDITTKAEDRFHWAGLCKEYPAAAIRLCAVQVDRPLFLIRLRQAEQEPDRRRDREDQQYPSSPDFPVFCAHRTALLSSNIVAKEHKSHKRYMPCSPKQHEFAPKRHSAGEKSMVKLE